MEDFSRNKQGVGKKFQQAFVHDIHNGETLIKKELLVIGSEEILLKHRIEMMTEFIKSLPAGDPQYGMIVAAIDMDKIEIDTLEIRKIYLVKSLDELEQGRGT